MNLVNERVSGLFIFFGTVQYLFVIMMLAMVEPGYSISANYISELGIGSNALVFITSMAIWGGTAAIAAVLLYRISAAESFFPSRLLAILLTIAGLCVMGAGLVPMYSTPGIPLHRTLTTIGILFAIVVIFLSYKLMKPPFSYIQIILGGLAVLTTILMIAGTDMGLGMGGMERMNAYVFILWLLGFSTFLMNKS